MDNLICPGDVIQYQEMGKIGSIRKDSVLTIEVSEKSTDMLLKNGDILHPKKHMQCVKSKCMLPLQAE